ncbi:MAG: SpoIIE family protein phosphatase [Clostridia bacterium]|nr:SpoIIE family protein phosphatase [Clostridia bacterium]
MKESAVRPREGNAAVTLAWCVVGLLTPRATLLGALSPFGIGLAACGRAANLPMLLCIAVGYLPVAAAMPLRYVAAVVLIGGVRWVLDTLPDGARQPFVPPLLAFVSCAATGWMSLMGRGADAYRLLLIVTEAMVAAGASLFFDMALEVTHHPRLPLSAGRQAALIAAAAVAVCAAATIEIGGFSPGRALAAVLVLLYARAQREAGGCVAGCVLGGGLALTAPAAIPAAAALAFGGLLAGIFARFGRVVQALLFLLGAVLISLTDTEADILFYLYEWLCAALLFVLLPAPWERQIARLLCRRRDLPAAEGVRRMAALRLQVACGAMEEVGRSVEEVSRRLSRHGAEDPIALWRSCAATVCAACPMRGVCWDRNREEMLAGFHTLAPRLQTEGHLSAEDLKNLPVTCRRADALAHYLTDAYAQYVAREEAWSRLHEIRQAVERQFCGTGALLSGLSARLQDPHGVDVDLSERILELCEDYGMAVEEALCTRDLRGRLTVHLLTRDEALPEGKWRRRMEKLCGCALTAPAVAGWGNRIRVTLTEPPRYVVEQGIAHHICRGETLCGDTVQTGDLSGGVLAVLSDGMGCGGRAAVDSAMAAGITVRLWQADFAPDAILQTVNAALLVKSREESLATLDVAAIDTHSGRLDLYKAGAAATLLRSGGRLSRLENTGLPVGILPDVSFAHSHDILNAGDILLMISDGALAGGTATVEELLAAHPDDGDMQVLAQAVVDAAVATEGDHPDDITAIALRLCLPSEEESVEI